MLPAKTADVAERASKAPRIRTGTFGDRSYDLNHEGYDADFADWEDPETFHQMFDRWSDDESADPARGVPDSASTNEAGQSLDDALWLKDTGHEPVLIPEELYALDRIADEVEVSRPIKKAVLRPVCDQDNV